MAQHDYVIANQGFPAFRSDLNDALAAVVSNNSGATEPTTMFAHQIWVDTAADPSVLKIRNADNDAWITVGTINQTADTFKLTPAGGISTDTIAELTSAAGVTIDGVLLKDGLVNTLTVGQGAGSVSTNTAVGASALAANTTGANNVAVGYQALDVNTTGFENTAVGSGALGANTTGVVNTAVGKDALAANTTGGSNAALGRLTLALNTTGSNNTGIGTGALYANTTASNNTAVGKDALVANTTGADNTAVGYAALDANTTGVSNTAVGVNALGANTTGTNNTAVGHAAGATVSTGQYNTLVGQYAGNALTSSSNTCVGAGAGYLITTGAKNTILGSYSGNAGGLDIRTASNNIVLSDGDGNPRMYYENGANAWRSIEIYNVTSGSAANMVSLASGTIARSTSSLKYKREVQNATHGLADVMQLRPVTYKGKNPEDGETVFGGLIAEEVHDVGLTEFVQYDADGSPDALAYGNMVSLCVKAIQELSAQVTALQTEVNTLKGN